MKKLKVLILANDTTYTFNLRSELIERLLADGCSVVVASQNLLHQDKLIGLGCRLVNIKTNRHGTNPLTDLILLIRYIKLLMNEKPDVVLSYNIKPNVYGGLACRLTNVPCIANVTGLGTSIENGGLLSILTVTLYRIGLKKAKCIFFQNKENMKFFEKKKIVHGNHRLIPGSGVNTEKHCMEEYPSEESGLRFLFIGRIMKDKGIDELLTAIRTVHEKYPDIKLDIVGNCDENYENTLNNAVKEGYIAYHGQQCDVHPFIKNAHCTVLPSYHEGMANVLLESASTGRPVIASRIPGCIETFDEGITGIGFEARNARSLTEAMERFIQLPWKEKMEMGIQARNKMKHEFDRNIVIKAYLEEINSYNNK